ncbi:inovirus-type Gp2 protein [Alcanivorax sp.]|uniref:YagK/YfjJ domain-containing protein n=1 Tax=Alcanivorax sp. TaxID=1872427 RepID=UPI0025BBA66A|nr:inovirus-type Gp2 protein [Alcanivorax sp.]
MFDDYYWKPPEAVSRSTILDGFHRLSDRRMLSVGKRVQKSALGQASACIFVERFVNRVITSSGPAYIFRPYAGMHETSIGLRLREVISLLGFFDSYHDYSEHLCAALHACWLIGSMYGLNLQEIGRADYQPNGQTAEALNQMVEVIRKSAGESWFRRAGYDRRYEANAKADSVARLVAQILRYYARTMIVRVDLGYQKFARKGLTIDDVYGHLDQMRSQLDVDAVFGTLVGYAWAFEQGENQGFHIHATFLFDGSKECRHIYKGFEIQSIWTRIVGLGGKAFVCNADLGRYNEDQIGIGMIHRHDAQSCLNAIQHNQYIAKDTQFLRIKPKGRRTFGSSIRPDLDAKGGRPPTHEPTWSYP